MASSSTDLFTSLPGLTDEDRIKLALDAGAIAGTWFWDVQRDHFKADTRFARCFSLDAEVLRQGVPLAEVVQSIHPDDESIVQRLIGQAMAAGGGYTAEYRVRQLDGSYRWLQASGHVALDAAGQAVSFPGVLIDIDARKRRELHQQALIALGDQLRDLHSIEAIAAAAARVCAEVLEVARAGYGLVQGLGTHVSIVADWCMDASVGSLSGVYRFEDFGTYNADLMVGRTVAIDDTYSHPWTSDQVDALAAIHVHSLLNVPLIQDGRLAAIVFVNHNGVHVWREDEIAFVRSIADRTWAAIAAARASDEMRRINADLEQEVRQRSGDRSLLWEISGDLMLLSRLDGHLVAVNPAWRKTLGWTEEELTGSSFFDLIHPDDVGRTQDAAEVIAQGGSFPVFDNRYRHRDGSYRQISWSAGPAGNLIVATGRDVTSIKSQETALRTSEEQLRQSQKMEAVGQLTGGIAHDFNNLLTIVSTSVQLLRRPDPEERRKSRLIDSIAGAVSRAAQLTGQLLAFARKQSLQPMVFDAKQNIVAIREMLQTLIGPRITLEVLGDDQPYWVDADPGQFDTAFVNMAANARDAMNREGSLSVVLRRVDAMPPVRSHPAVQGNFIAISIADTGSGIAESDLVKIFEPFYTTKPVGEGTGLGLSQVFGFAKQSGGEVQVESTLGRGTTFTMYLPQAVRKVAHRPHRVVESETIASGTVLLIEDNLDVATAAELALTDIGYVVHTCPGAAEALAALADAPSRFTVIFTDVMMAGMDGVTLAREVRRLYPTLPIVLTSGYSSILANSQELEFPLLAKPYEPDSLARVLREAVVLT